MYRRFTLCLFALLLTGCLATKAVTTTVGVATKATVLTVKTTAKVAIGAADLVIPDGDDKDDKSTEED